MTYMNSLRIIGLMSGTSLDGIDLADIVFTRKSDKWSFEVIRTQSYSFSDELLAKLAKADQVSAPKLFELDVELSLFYGTLVLDYLKKNNIDKSEIDAVASHGQTIFHQPHKGFTVQIGNRPQAAIKCGIKWICDFRIEDVALGGNGAPLVPIGDFNLFNDRAEAFLNLGGFSNISFKKNNTITAYDISPANIVLNKICQEISGKTFDENGDLGKKGKVNKVLLKKLNDIKFYNQNPPKSLGTEWLKDHFYPILKDFSFDVDLLRTVYEHIAIQIAKNLDEAAISTVMVSGGGVRNKFLLSSIEKHYAGKVIIPSDEIIDFKEAIIFAFLGALRLRGESNVLAEYTGAQRDSSSGVVYLP